MADKSISELTAATSVTAADLFVLEQSNTAKKLTGYTLEQWLLSMADGHGGITDITWTTSGTSGQGQYHYATIHFADESTSTFTIRDGINGNKGDKGDKGDKGTSITNISKTASSGVVDTYTVYFDDGTTTTFTITNGSDISEIAKTSTSGLIDTYTITLTDGATHTFTVTNGRSIVSLAMVGGTHAAGTTDTYRITFNDGSTQDFTVYNGANGTGAVSSVAGIGVSGENGDVPLIRTGQGAPTSSTVGQANQLYFDTAGSVMYICLGEIGGSYSWLGAGITVDSGLNPSSTNPVQNAVITAKIGTSALNTDATNLSDAINEVLTEMPQAASTTPVADSASGAVGSQTAYARGNHSHPINVDNTVPSALGTAATGSASTYARRDHVHPMPTPTQVGALALAGNQYLVNPVDDLSNYATGIALFNNATSRPVANFPYEQSVTQWALVISGKADAGTVFQVAYNLLGGSSPRFRNCASGTWTAWKDVNASLYEPVGTLGIASGGTGATTAAAALANLGITDSGWIEVTFTSEFKNYGSTNRCQYRKVGNVVTVCGAATPVNDIAGSNTQYTMFTLPVGFRPKVVMSSIQQGSGDARWQMQIGSGNGAVTFSRYADDTGYITANGGSPGAWLVFSATYLTA